MKNRILSSLVITLLFLSLSTSLDVNQRPGFHFTSPINWLNDPNGPMYYKGVYHLFYQHYPYGNYWSSMHWGHSVSTNLLDWVHLDIALYPDTEADGGGVFSGSAVIDDNGVPMLFYTGVVNKTQEQWTCSARPIDPSDILLQKWTKNPSNPVFKQPFSNLTGGFRDPTTPWRNPITKEWNMLVGSGNGDQGGVATLYSSSDLKNWRFVGFFTKCNGKFGCSDFFECPDFFPIQSQGNQAYVFKFSDQMTWSDYYSIGGYNPSLSDSAFIDKGRKSMLDWGKGNWYASKSFMDEKNNRRLYWGWIKDTGTSEGAKERGWQGVLTLKIVTLTDDNVLALNPIPELIKLRDKQFQFGRLKLTNQKKEVLKGEFGGKLDVQFVVNNMNSSFGINLRASEDGREYTQLRFHSPRTFGKFDLIGGDYKDFPTRDYLNCMKECENDIGCIAYSFSPSGPKDNSTHCVLKRPNRIVPVPSKKPGLSSGTKAYITIDTSKSSLKEPTPSLVMPIFDQNKMDVRIVMDNSLLEIYVNGGRHSLTTRIYPSLSTSVGIQLFGIEQETVVDEMNVWTMKNSFINFSDLPIRS